MGERFDPFQNLTAHYLSGSWRAERRRDRSRSD